MSRSIETFEKFASKNGLEVNIDNAQDVILGLKEKHRVFGIGYCPCLPQYLHKIPDTVCPCFELKENKICRCGLFICEK